MSRYEFAGRYESAEEAGQDCARRAWQEGIKNVRVIDVEPMKPPGFWTVKLSGRDPFIREPRGSGRRTA